MKLLLDTGMGLALVCFLGAGFAAYRKNSRAHRWLALTGVALTVAIGLALIIAVRVIHHGEMHAAGVVPVAGAPAAAIIVHRLAASAVFGWMLLQAWRGWRRDLPRHRRDGRWFLAAYATVYASGFFLFTAAP